MDNVRKTHYDAIGVEPAASRDAIEEACLRLSDECRADKSLEPQFAARLLADIEEIRATLADPDKRARYDAELALEMDWDKRAQHHAEVSRQKKLEHESLPAAKRVPKDELPSNRGPLAALAIVATIAAALALGAAIKWTERYIGADPTVPPLLARVNDLTGTLEVQHRQTLETMLAQFEARKGSQIAVLIVPSTAPETVEQYAVRVEEAWKLGRKGIDDGILLLVAKGDRRLRIEVGYGLEGVLPDAIARRIIEDDIVPRFKANDFYGGIRAGTERIIRVIDGEKLPPLAAGGTHRGEPWTWFSVDGIKAFLGCVFVICIVACIMTFLGQFLGAVVTAALAAYTVLDMRGSDLMALLWGALAFAISFLIYPVIRDFWQDFWSSDESSDGGWFSGGGGDGGGFSGGGGGSGGGGASGSW